MRNKQNFNLFFTLLLFISNFFNAQVTGDIIGTTVISGQTQFVKINPNTGFVTVIGNQTASINILNQYTYNNLTNAAYDCNNNNYVFGANYNNQDLLLVINKTSGVINSTYGYPIIGLTFNKNNGLYYGLEVISTSGYKLVSFDPIVGTKNTITTSTISTIDYLELTKGGFSLDLNSGKYIFLYNTPSGLPIQKIYSIDIQTGSVANFPINYVGNVINPLICIVHNNYNNITYGLVRYDSGTASSLADSMYFCKISLNGILTKIAHIPQHFYNFPMGSTGPSSNATLNSQDGVYTFIDYQKRLTNINIYTGSIISDPTISSTNPVSSIQYAGCNLVDIKELLLAKKINVFFPNPSNNKIIYINKLILKNEDLVLKIYNKVGQIVFQDIIKSNYYDEPINLTKLNEGFYTIEFSSKTETYYNPLIIN